VSAERIAEHVTDGRLDGSVIRTAISRLRRVLGERVETTASGYRLVLDDGELDAGRFASLVVPDPAAGASARIAALTNALTLWRGRALGEMADEPWAVSTAARLEYERADAIEGLADALVEAGRASEAITLLQPAIDLHPYRERPVAIVMRAFTAMGRRTEGLVAFERLRMALRDVGLEPSDALRQVERELLEGAGDAVDLPRTVAVPGNLRRPVASFVGRGREVKQLAGSLRDRRLLTLVGPGGVGKTRLALEVASVVAADFPAGVWVIELAPVDDGDALLRQAMTVLGAFPDAGVSPLASIADVLRDRRALVVIDNAEHLLVAAGTLAAAIVGSGDGVRVVVTSRQALDVPGEHVHPVAPLDSFDSVDLFCTRSAEADDTFEYDDDDRVDIETICTRLDGLPLAIELAAAQTRSMTTADVLGLLDLRFDQLPLPATGAESYVTLHAAIDWSYRLLDPSERRLFDRTAVFSGGFDFDALTAVCAAPGQHTAVRGLLASLIDQSMVTVDRRGRSARYRLLEPVRHYALARLQERGEVDATRERHVEHYTEVARRVYRDNGTDQGQAHALLDREWDNLRAAVHAAVAADDFDHASAIVGALPLALSVCRDEHRDWVATVLHRMPEGHRRTPLMYCYVGWWANLLGEHREALRCASVGLALAPADAVGYRVQLMTVHAEALIHLGQPEEALAAAQDLLAMARSEPEASSGLMLACWSAWGCRPELVAGYATRLSAIAQQTGRQEDRHQAAYAAGIAALIDGEPQAAVAYFREARKWSTGLRMLEAEALQGLTLGAAAANDDETAPIFLDAIEVLAAERAWAHLYMVLEALAIHLADTGRTEHAAVLLGGLDAHGRSSVFLVDGRRRVRAAVDDRRFGAAVARGRSMDRAELIQFSIDVLDLRHLGR
jgi:predicted ATPase/DNA-binding SARP family transcriptional activator